MPTLGHTAIKVAVSFALVKSLFSCSWGFTKVFFYGMTPRLLKLVNTVHQLNQCNKIKIDFKVVFSELWTSHPVHNTLSIQQQYRLMKLHSSNVPHITVNNIVLISKLPTRFSSSKQSWSALCNCNMYSQLSKMIHLTFCQPCSSHCLD